MITPICFLVPGTPVSFQSRREAVRQWKEKVASIARTHVSEPNEDSEFAVSITHFYRAPPRCDTDNMAKPICDALNEIIYRDDWQVVERVARRIPLDRSFSLWGMPRELALALCAGDDFVYIRIARVRAMTLCASWNRSKLVSAW